jgi:hypothetical protein
MPNLTVSAAVDNFMGAADVAAMKVAVGVGNVNDTSDANKPVSTAQQAAINAKASLLISNTTNEAAASTDRLSALSASQVSWQDFAATVEPFANLTSWALGANGPQVSGGRAYSNGVGGSGSGMNRALSAGSSEFRVQLEINTVVGVAISGGLMIGISTDTAGATPTVGAGTAYGLYFKSTTASAVQSVTAGVFTDLPDGTNATPGTYVVKIVADALYLTITATKSDGSYEYSFRWTRAGKNLNNLFNFNSDTRALSGHSVGKIGWRLSPATVVPRAGVETIAPSALWSGDGTNSWRIAFPTAYDSRIPSPVAICWHGNGSDARHFATNLNGRTVANALLAAGYIVISASYDANLSTWGAQPEIDANVAAYKYLKARYAIGPIVFYANSMGGIGSVLAITQGVLPRPRAWVGTSPAFSLLNNYSGSGGAGGGNFTAVITTAYGISGGNYSTVTAGHDPALINPENFRGVPMMIIAATDDVSVPYNLNGQLLINTVPGSTVTLTTGGHSFSFAPYTSQIVNYFNAVL